MKLIKTLSWSMALAAGLFIGSAAPIGSAQDPDQSRGKREEPASVTGELTRVNTTSMTFSVKSASGAEMLFKYDERTIVTGAETNPAGLATASGSTVTVTYRNDSAGNIAAKIEVHGKR
jgi:hypothetical protein